ncbi:MAG: amino acid racemase [Sulfurospirillum sp.]
MHKKIGIIGGLSPESTVSYYLYITRAYADRFGDYSYPEIIIYSVNMTVYHQWRDENRWDLIIKDMADVANKLKAAGADFGLITTNTMHKVFDQVQQKTSLTLLNLIDVTALDVKQKNIRTVGLLGTKYTMSEDFYSSRLEKNNLTVLVPEPKDQETIHKIIIQELVRGEILEQSKNKYLNIINKLKQQGAKGIILGCTEIPLLIKQSDCDIPLIDTATIHAEAALLYAIDKQ